MNSTILELVDLSVVVAGKQVCHKINLLIKEKECHIFLGPNGSGKSSLLNTIMGLPEYQISSEKIVFRGTVINKLKLDQRARLGIGMSFQRPPKLNGVSVQMFVQALKAEELFKEHAAALKLANFAERIINDGFSGGELKRWEVLKLFLQQPLLCLFDEPESGVDFAHIEAMGKFIQRLLSQPNTQGQARAGLLITHTGLILQHIAAATAHIMVDGEIISSGAPTTILQHVKTTGYVHYQQGEIL